ncbi:phosphoribosylpyrophosphate synthase [Wigglesworthia glossinidia endosymbiont of Glossina morsitans morsitans (Yale colony)]|uniref:ribose-phosphate diphosphokinase n=1 Tax=Wigglesworthia glossinidia endosymbiont of Glossina morsitans morsitans (Yale colony) TaxID=1142511 RepID=H6Q4W7_WIGGL|nr:ribose-phosphate diphosphokinase [Wigglesworthia glossinidia]AFA41250.1 phosphoribosylpyrophosphate synthase [Wigglesworthia glossinidia endosymbiont of Glossina morsitans morsitans (Yale colony)]
MKIFFGTSVKHLANLLSHTCKIKLSPIVISRFKDNEINVKIDENVRGEDVCIIQSTCYPANDNLMELMIIADALKRAAAKKIITIIPYYGYGRQDRRINLEQVPITAKLVANLLSISGIDQIATIDIHCEQIQGFFDIVFDSISAETVFLEDIRKKNFLNPVIVAPDFGSIRRARKMSKALKNVEVVVIEKIRPNFNETQVANIIGNVKNRDCILVDDIIDTASTLCKSAYYLKNQGASNIVCYTTHPVLSENAFYTMQKSVIDEFIVCDTIPINLKFKKLSNIKILTISKLIEKYILNIII